MCLYDILTTQYEVQQQQIQNNKRELPNNNNDEDDIQRERWIKTKNHSLHDIYYY